MPLIASSDKSKRRRIYVIPCGIHFTEEGPEALAFTNQKDAYLPRKFAPRTALHSAFGGLQEKGEDALETALRELREETGDWFDTAVMPAQTAFAGVPLSSGIGPLCEFLDVENGEDYLFYIAWVDVGPVSWRLLTQSIREGGPGVVNLAAMDHLGDQAFVNVHCHAYRRALDLLTNAYLDE